MRHKTTRVPISGDLCHLADEDSGKPYSLWTTQEETE